MANRLGRFVATGDIVGDICRRFEEDSAVSAEVSMAVEREARAVYGGERIHIRSSLHLDTRIALAKIDPDRPVPEQARELGLGRVTVWRYIQRLKRKPHKNKV